MSKPLSERLDIAIKIHEDMSGESAMSRTLREAAALARRVEGAAVGRLDIGRDDLDDAEMVEIVMDPNHVSHLQYQRVRIVPEPVEGGA